MKSMMTMAVKAFTRERNAVYMLHAIRDANPLLDLHGGLACAAPVQRIHLKELRRSSPRSDSARQRMKRADESSMTRVN